MFSCVASCGSTGAGLTASRPEDFPELDTMWARHCLPPLQLWKGPHQCGTAGPC